MVMIEGPEKIAASMPNLGSPEEMTDSISFHLTPDHMLAGYLHAAKRLGNRYRRNRVFQAALLVVLVSMMFVLSSLGRLHNVLENSEAHHWFAWVISSLVMALASILIVFYVAKRICAKVAVTARPKSSVKYNVIADRRGLHVNWDDGESRLSWKNVLTIDMDEDNLFVVLIGEQCFVIPRDAFQSAEAAEMFIKTIRVCMNET